GPSYGFIVLIFLMLIAGIYRVLAHGTPMQEVAMQPDPSAVKGLDIGILLRGFASGCAALTGIEAVSNGVQAFKKPEAKNAAFTLGILGGILAVMFIGITYLAATFHVGPKEGAETVVSQIARASFGTQMPLGVLYYAVQTATVLI